MTQAIYKPKGRALEYGELAANPYRGCDGRCFYCYVPKMLRIPPAAFHGHTKPRPGFLEQFEKDAKRIRGANQRVFFCFSCDPYPTIEREHQITRRALEICKKYQVPFWILTKQGQAPINDFDVYWPDCVFSVTLTSLLRDCQQRYEAGTASPAERIAALIEADRRGIPTAVSLEPVIDYEESLEIIKETNEVVDHYMLGTLNYHDNGMSIKQWREFVQRAINLFTAYKKTYWIKHDLDVMLSGIKFKNTDLRRAPRKPIGNLFV
jgi:DNA repair photolyase